MFSLSLNFGRLSLNIYFGSTVEDESTEEYDHELPPVYDEVEDEDEETIDPLDADLPCLNKGWQFMPMGDDED